MNPLATLTLVPLIGGICGITVALFVGRAPMSGRVSVALLCLPVLSILLLAADFGGDTRELVSWGLFGFSVPVCLAYSFHARRRASDRRAALAGFMGSILFSLIWLLTMPQFAFDFVREITGSH
jgi:hypothetical protein